MDALGSHNSETDLNLMLRLGQVELLGKDLGTYYKLLFDS